MTIGFAADKLYLPPIKAELGMVLAEKRIVSPEEYLTTERQALDKSEFFNGELIPMAVAQTYARTTELIV